MTTFSLAHLTDHLRVPRDKLEYLALAPDGSEMLHYRGLPFSGLAVSTSAGGREEAEYIDGLLEGATVVYAESGLAVRYRETRYGKEHGRFAEWYPDGALRRIGEMRLGHRIWEQELDSAGTSLHRFEIRSSPEAWRAYLDAKRRGPLDLLTVACIDVGYRDNEATAAVVVFDRHETLNDHRVTERVLEQRRTAIAEVEDYIPGAFYRRELPCVLAILGQVQTWVDVVIVDGFVTLDGGRAGLGMHLYERLGGEVPVIGVAKTAWRGATDVIEVTRGSSDRPLYVSAVGLPLRTVARYIERLAGPHRIPDMLARVDRLSRSGTERR